MVCKVLESIIHDKMDVHMMNNNLISDQQHGFRSRRSCIAQRRLIMEHLSKLLTKETVQTLFIWISKKVIDTVPHQRLITKLKKSTISLIALLTGYHHIGIPQAKCCDQWSPVILVKCCECRISGKRARTGTSSDFYQ